MHRFAMAARVTAFQQVISALAASTGSAESGLIIRCGQMSTQIARPTTIARTVPRARVVVTIRIAPPSGRCALMARAVALVNATREIHRTLEDLQLVDMVIVAMKR